MLTTPVQFGPNAQSAAAFPVMMREFMLTQKSKNPITGVAARVNHLFNSGNVSEMRPGHQLLASAFAETSDYYGQEERLKLLFRFIMTPIVRAMVEKLSHAMDNNNNRNNTREVEDKEDSNMRRKGSQESEFFYSTRPVKRQLGQRAQPHNYRLLDAVAMSFNYKLQIDPVSHREFVTTGQVSGATVFTRQRGGIDDQQLLTSQDEEEEEEEEIALHRPQFGRRRSVRGAQNVRKVASARTGKKRVALSDAAASPLINLDAEFGDSTGGVITGNIIFRNDDNVEPSRAAGPMKKRKRSSFGTPAKREITTKHAPLHSNKRAKKTKKVESAPLTPFDPNEFSFESVSYIPTPDTTRFDINSIGLLSHPTPSLSTNYRIATPLFNSAPHAAATHVSDPRSSSPGMEKPQQSYSPRRQQQPIRKSPTMETLLAALALSNFPHQCHTFTS